ncbi:hypothetical protein [Cryobacterium melibiosiphilum]|uniref:hypothetical protein n=1 Tax=Cryobacterium melibiosiphilum TaxID=995039 RepID=UPI0018F5325B|nr:hypothetical protein [Cryobacterium melibiosiphilum]
MTSLSTEEAPRRFLESDRAHVLLVRVIRIAFPHDTLPVSAYERTADSLLNLAVQTNRMTLAVANGLDSLGSLPQGDFLGLPDDEAFAHLKSIERTEFFTFVRGNTVLTLYNLPEVWAALGYEGASVEKGGYLTRGFDDLNWLPDPRVEEYSGELTRVEQGPLPYPVKASRRTEADEVTL